MKTDVITVYSDLRGREEAMDTAERFAAYNSIKGKDAMHLRLLTEEIICMVHGILDITGFSAGYASLPTSRQTELRRSTYSPSQQAAEMKTHAVSAAEYASCSATAFRLNLPRTNSSSAA